MSSIIIYSLVLFALFSSAIGISCIICDSLNDSGCGKTYVSGAGVSRSGYGSCSKTVYTSSYGSVPSGTVVRRGHNTTYPCTAVTTSYATVYCCSNKSDCNGAIGYAASMLLASTMVLSVFYAKRWISS